MLASKLLVRVGYLTAVLCLSTLGVEAATTATEWGLPAGSSGQPGLLEDRVPRIRAFLQHDVDTAQLAGFVWLVARHGHVVDSGAIGWRDVAAHAPMTPDTIFRIYSMTKIITTVTALTLVEEGKINLNDPISKYLPEFASPRVFTGGTADAPQTVAAESPITVRELLSQSSGLRYDVFGNDTLHDIYVRAHLWDSDSLKDFAHRVSQLPLEHQPGARWTYGVNTDILGDLIEVVSGEPLEQIERERIFIPLGMEDTSFSVPDAKLPRLAKLYKHDEAGKLTETPPFGGIMSQPRGTFRSGGGGLFSTAHDYARFAQMLLNGGEWNGKRLLGRKTVEMMSSIQIIPVPGPWSPPAFGLGVQVMPADMSKLGSLGSPGSFGWDGYASTHVLIDPHEDLFLLLLTQFVPTDPDSLFESFNNTVYQAVP